MGSYSTELREYFAPLLNVTAICKECLDLMTELWLGQLIRLVGNEMRNYREVD